MGKKPKFIQIDTDLFFEMVRYINDHADLEDPSYQEIHRGVLRKLVKIVEHDHFTEYKTALTKEDRVQALNRYLNDIGVPTSFRYGNTVDTSQPRDDNGGDEV